MLHLPVHQQKLCHTQVHQSAIRIAKFDAFHIYYISVKRDEYHIKIRSVKNKDNAHEDVLEKKNVISEI